jgi:hypothetical protein
MPLRQVLQVWIVFAAAYAASVSATINQVKAPPARCCSAASLRRWDGRWPVSPGAGRPAGVW